MTPAPLAVSLRAARLVYSGLTLFDGLDLELTGGCFTCLLGPSGIGKTSLLRLLAGLTAIGISGELRGDDGLPLTGRVAYMAQQDLLLPWLNVLDNVTLGSRLRGERPDRAGLCPSRTPDRRRSGRRCDAPGARRTPAFRLTTPVRPAPWRPPGRQSWPALRRARLLLSELPRPFPAPWPGQRRHPRPSGGRSAC